MLGRYPYVEPSRCKWVQLLAAARRPRLPLAWQRGSVRAVEQFLPLAESYPPVTAT